jgi:hypothetical protein
MNKKLWMILELGMLIVWIITLIIFLSNIWTEGTICKANPLKFGINKLNSNNDSFYCKCQTETDFNNYIYVDSNKYEWRSNQVNNYQLKL